MLLAGLLHGIVAAAVPAAASVCVADIADRHEMTWCASIGGTLDADTRRLDAGGEITRVGRAVAGRVWQHKSTRLELGYRYDSFEVDDFVVANLDLHRLDFRLSHRHTTPRAEWFLLAGPMIATSSNRLSDLQFGSDDLGAEVAVLMRPRDTAWRLGAMFDRRLGRARWYPAVAWDRRLSDAIEARLGIPDTTLALRHRRWRWALALTPTGDRWHALDKGARRRFDVGVERWELALTARPPGGHACRGWFARLGVAFARRIAFTSTRGERIETGLEPALFAAIGHGCVAVEHN